MGGLSIGEMSERTGLSIDTLRYYERVGLVAPARDESSRHRRYGDEDVRWLEFVTALRSTGMPLEDIRAYLRLYLQGDRTFPERQAIMAAQAQRVEGRLAELRAALEAIRKKQAFYARKAKESKP